MTLDKEQLSVDKEMLEEKVADLELELETARLEVEAANLSAMEPSMEGGEGAADIRALSEQNEQNAKLRAALMKLQVRSNKAQGRPMDHSSVLLVSLEDQGDIGAR